MPTEKKKGKHWKINRHVYLQRHIALEVLAYVVAHGRWPHGTDWLNETAAETYVPLLSMLNEIVDSGRSPHNRWGNARFVGTISG